MIVGVIQEKVPQFQRYDDGKRKRTSRLTTSVARLFNVLPLRYFISFCGYQYRSQQLESYLKYAFDVQKNVPNSRLYECKLSKESGHLGCPAPTAHLAFDLSTLLTLLTP